MKNEKSKKLFNTILNAIIIALSLFVVVLTIVGLFSLGSSAIAVGTSDNLMYAMYPFEITLGGTDGYYTIDGTPTLNSSMIQDGYTESTSATSGGAISTDSITVTRDRFTYTQSDNDAEYYFNYDTDAQFTQVRISGRDWYCRGSIPPVQSIHLPDNVSCNYVITVEVEYWDQDDIVTYTYNGHSAKGTSVTLIRNDEMWTEDIAKDYNFIHIVSYNCLLTLTTSDVEYYQDFTIDGTTYTSPVDTTWSAWCMSDYNTGGFYVNEDDNLVYKSEYEKLTYNGNDVSGGTLIVDGGAYSLVDIAVESLFYVGETQYTFIEGLTWMQWVLTDYNTDHFYLEEDTNTLFTADDKEILYDGNGISGSYVIIANGVYTIAVNVNELVGTWVLPWEISSTIDVSAYLVYSDAASSQVVATIDYYSPATLEYERSVDITLDYLRTEKYIGIYFSAGIGMKVMYRTTDGEIVSRPITNLVGTHITFYEGDYLYDDVALEWLQANATKM